MPITPDSEADAKKRLKEFLRETVVFVRDLALEPYDRDDNLFLREELLPAVEKGWEHFEEDFDLEEQQAKIDLTDPIRLETHGLYGAQLDLKLAAVRFWFEEFGRRKIKKVLIWLIDTVDTVLRSLLDACGLDKALEELKDILRNCIKD